MGNRTSRKIFQKKEHYSRQSRMQPSNQNFDQQCYTQPHMDSHYAAMDKILNDHFIHIQSDSDIQQAAMNIHRNALNIAMRQHRNAVYMNSPNYQQIHQMIYAV